MTKLDPPGTEISDGEAVDVLPVLRTPELDTVLQVRSQKSRVEGQNHLPRPADPTSFDATQDVIDFLCCQYTLPTHVKLFIHKHSQVLLLRAALQPFSTQHVFVPGIAMSLVQDLALGLVELHAVCTGPPLKPVQVPLDVIPSLQRVNRATQLGVISKLTEGALNATIHVSNKEVKQHSSPYQPLRNTTCHWPSTGHLAIDRNPLSAAIQPVPYPPSGPSIKFMTFQF
ncbi:hypothetical protein llap_8184 [Limosa lapponica baueri]|uniref:Uncharacterized protein n=1 Tax=Limosa lapponica baueri TaxID=1758121 RepID=A0A2I0U627_LIMLA|nr:hypothetical protein llap_8184 [Limosa lapponica baueri]